MDEEMEQQNKQERGKTQQERGNIHRHVTGGEHYVNRS